MLTVSEAAAAQLKEISSAKADPEKVMLRIDVAGFG